MTEQGLPGVEPGMGTAPPPDSAVGGSAEAGASSADETNRQPISPRQRGATLAILAVGIALIVVLAGLFVAGVFSGPSGSKGISVPVALLPSYAQARNASDEVVSEVGGGPWILNEAIGVDAAQAAYLPSVTDYSLGYGCTATPVDGEPTTLYAPPLVNESLSSGVAPWWAFVFQSASAHTALMVQVANGTATPRGILSGVCLSNTRTLYTVPASVLNSPVAAEGAWQSPNAPSSAWGSSYVANHSGATVVLGLSPFVYTGPFTPLGGSTWIVDYSMCNAFGNAGASNQSEVSDWVNASTGAYDGFVFSSSRCEPPTSSLSAPLSSALDLGNVSNETCPTGSNVTAGATGGCFPGHAALRMTIQASVVPLGDLFFVVANLSTHGQGHTLIVSPGPGAFTVLNGKGEVVASYVVPSGDLWLNTTWSTYTSGVSNTTSLSSNDTIVIDIGGSALPSRIQVDVLGQLAYFGPILVPVP